MKDCLCSLYGLHKFLIKENLEFRRYQIFANIHENYILMNISECTV